MKLDFLNFDPKARISGFCINTPTFEMYINSRGYMDFGMWTRSFRIKSL